MTANQIEVLDKLVEETEQETISVLEEIAKEELADMNEVMNSYEKGYSLW